MELVIYQSTTFGDKILKIICVNWEEGRGEVLSIPPENSEIFKA